MISKFEAAARAAPETQGCHMRRTFLIVMQKACRIFLGLAAAKSIGRINQANQTSNLVLFVRLV